MKKSMLRCFFILLTLLAWTSAQAQDCENDQVAPVPVCNDEIPALAIPDYGAIVLASDMDGGSWDNCSPVSLRITTVADDTGVPPASSSILLPPILAHYPVALYVLDESDNWTKCWGIVNVDGFNTGGCTEDTEAPNAVCLDEYDITIPQSGLPAAVSGGILADASTDNCDVLLFYNVNLLEASTGMPQGSNQILFHEPGDYEIEVWVIDDFGNYSSCQTTVIVSGVGCEGDNTPPVAVCQSDWVVDAHPIDGIAIDALQIDEGSYDLCSAVDLRLVLLEDDTDVPPTTTSVQLPPVLGDYILVLWVGDENGNWNKCWAIVTIGGFYTPVQGQIFTDSNGDCLFDSGEANSGYSGWTIRATHLPSGNIWETITTSNGSYELVLDGALAASDIQVEVLVPDGLATGCVSSVSLDGQAGPVYEAHFSIGLEPSCSFLTVDVSTPFVRRCFDNTYYVHYVNYAAFSVPDAVVQVQLDPLMQLQSASLPYLDLGNGQYQFDLGTLPAGSDGQIELNVLLSCDAALGATHCVEATIAPFDCDSPANFADLRVTGWCDEQTDQVKFRIENTGNAPTAAPRAMRIVEDVVMYMQQNQVDLGIGESAEFSYPANGATWRLEIDQDENYPYGVYAADFVEGCAGFTPGMATLFSLNDEKPYVAIDCQENIGAWDPNDKQAFPKGYGSENYIETNTPIEYLIRFQNTGTDTAFNVLIEDRISPYLDFQSLMPGASSHPYRLEALEEGLLRFHFDNIMLPDSNINQAASNGFVKFFLSQQPDNAIGTLIENTASIYFDFNEAVVTNTVKHTVGENFIVVNAQEISQAGISMQILPHPVENFAHIQFDGIHFDQGYFQLIDQQGRLVQITPFSGTGFRLERGGLPTGLFFYRVFDGEKAVIQGKLLVK
ncbi:MAG TPA: hypothetical protein PKA00_10445 [Saprospiraceae bacterium]|mgnify:CR=1 FL=1|nr:hypothetical protein [Saprospiraceae bacterium]HMQ83319.1 hypothetical protein [Saprospiraceae bacterium]